MILPSYNYLKGLNWHNGMWGKSLQLVKDFRLKDLDSIIKLCYKKKSQIKRNYQGNQCSNMHILHTYSLRSQIAIFHDNHISLSQINEYEIIYHEDINPKSKNYGIKRIVFLNRRSPSSFIRFVIVSHLNSNKHQFHQFYEVRSLDGGY